MNRNPRCTRCGSLNNHGWLGTPYTAPQHLLVRCARGHCRAAFLRRPPRGTDHGARMTPDRQTNQSEFRP